MGEKGGSVGQGEEGGQEKAGVDAPPFTLHG